jgi:hypothetical protein
MGYCFLLLVEAETASVPLLDLVELGADELD